MPLLLLPGLMCDSRVFAPQIAAFAGERAVIVADYGDADRLVLMAERALDQAPPRFAVAGHSMGARVALEVYRRAPDRVLKLALISTGVHLPQPGEAEKRHALVDIGHRRGIDALLDEWLRPMVAPARRNDTDLIASIRAMCAEGGVARCERQIAALLARPEAESLLPRLNIPVLVAVGDADVWSPPEQHRAMAAMIRHAELVVFEGSGHMAPLEAPDELNVALRRWLDD